MGFLSAWFGFRSARSAQQTLRHNTATTPRLAPTLQTIHNFALRTLHQLPRTILFVCALGSDPQRSALRNKRLKRVYANAYFALARHLPYPRIKCLTGSRLSHMSGCEAAGHDRLSFGIRPFLNETLSRNHHILLSGYAR